jgi:hypothetical protein
MGGARFSYQRGYMNELTGVYRFVKIVFDWGVSLRHHPKPGAADLRGKVYHDLAPKLCMFAAGFAI